MPFESLWSRVPLAARWVISLGVAAVLVVLLIIFIDHHNSNGEVPVSAKNLRIENQQAAIVVGQQQAPKGVRLTAGTSRAAVITALTAAVRRDMQHQIYQTTIAGPLQDVHCVVHGGTLAHTGYHCLAKANGVQYPFLAVVTTRARHAWFCEKVYPPSPSENIPVSARCRAPA